MVFPAALDRRLFTAAPHWYTARMTADTIRDMLHREPFEPFRIVTTSGEAYTVRNPDLVALMKSEVFIAQPNSDRRTFVPLLHVSAVETLAALPARRERPRRRQS